MDPVITQDLYHGYNSKTFFGVSLYLVHVSAVNWDVPHRVKRDLHPHTSETFGQYPKTFEILTFNQKFLQFRCSWTILYTPSVEFRF